MEKTKKLSLKILDPLEPSLFTIYRGKGLLYTELSPLKGRYTFGSYSKCVLRL